VDLNESCDAIDEEIVKSPHGLAQEPGLAAVGAARGSTMPGQGVRLFTRLPDASGEPAEHPRNRSGIEGASMAVLQGVTDSLAAAQLADTVSVRADTLGAPPLPGGISPVVRAMFSAPTWLWILIIALAASLAAWGAWMAWKHRTAWWTWLRTRSRGATIALIAVAALIVLVVSATGAASWNFMQHDNRFCVSCHVMTPAFQAMRTSTVHDSLGCHDCHSQSMFASAWQLYVWLKDRPEKIEKHADVPNTTCTGCHSGDDEKWQRVARTAGHRVHLESDSSALADVACTTCHAEEVHRFVPADRTCGQSGCHSRELTRIAIGPMANQTALHCITCHQYTAELPQNVSLDSARSQLQPGSRQCFSCHAMRERLADFNPAREPHGGQCGMCHNPHTQNRPSEALKQCASAGCHVDWRDIPFHTGAIHRRAAEQCATCHTPHSARVDASDCQGCHADVARRIPRLRRLQQGFDTTRTLRGALLPDAHPAPLAKWTAPAGKPLAPAVDSFEHRRHRSLACLTCHDVHSSSRITFTPPRGCQICHHQAPAENRCSSCHAADEIAAPHARTVTVTVGSGAPRPRTVNFRHENHARLACPACHTQQVTLEIGDSVRTCAACHDDHHQAARTCGGCHTERASFAPHTPPAAAHTACDACHATRTIARLVPDRAMCLTCHESQRDHMTGRECSTCHFLADPPSYRRHLVAG